jgi:hypothetical protein
MQHPPICAGSCFLIAWIQKGHAACRGDLQIRDKSLQFWKDKMQVLHAHDTDLAVVRQPHASQAHLQQPLLVCDNALDCMGPLQPVLCAKGWQAPKFVARQVHQDHRHVLQHAQQVRQR